MTTNPDPGLKPGPNETFCRARGSIVMRAAAYCFVCSISDPGVVDDVATVDPGGGGTPMSESDLRGANRKLPWPLAGLLVSIGCTLGLPAIFLSETAAGAIAAWISAPVVEELFKPFGVYLLIARWPRTVRRQPSIAALCGLAGLSFGLMESALYVFVYQPSDAGDSYAAFRFTVPVALHIATSTIFGFGVNRREFQVLAAGRLPSKRSWPFIVAAMVTHATYNIVVTVLALI